MPVPRRPGGGGGEAELLLGLKVCLLGQVLQLCQQQVPLGPRLKYKALTVEIFILQGVGRFELIC